MWVYVRSEPQLWTVGFYDPDGKFQPESDHGESGAAADRVAWLNGGLPFHVMDTLQQACNWFMERSA